MTTYSSCRMDLDAGVDRTQPLPLREHIDPIIWNDFCDQIEAVHKAGTQSSQLTGIAAGILTLVGFAMFGVGGYLSVEQQGFSPLVIIGMILFISGPIYYIWKNKFGMSTYTEDIKRICTYFSSTKFQNVTVHFRSETTVARHGGMQTYGTHGTHGTTSHNVYHTTTWLEFIYSSDSVATATATEILVPSAPYMPTATATEIPIPSAPYMPTAKAEVITSN